ncbi:MAG: TonB family protein [Acidobacteria bacterium]|nr:TonB family protein [Acidobacteriota bacterium]
MALPSWAGSVALHLAGIAALFLFRPAEVLNAPKLLLSVDIVPPQKLAAPPASKAIGGGGGDNATKPASRGRLPRIADLVFVKPATKPTEIEPALAIEPAIVAAPPIQTAAIALGDPLGLPGPPSDGPGKKGGIGRGGEGGVGNKTGPRAGDGDSISGAFSLRAVSTAPALIHKVDPEYSDEARKARFNGTVLLRIVIDTNGLPTNVEVLRSPGLGLGERAVQSVSQWRFRPGRRDGKPVPVWATVEVNFSLL